MFKVSQSLGFKGFTGFFDGTIADGLLDFSRSEFSGLS